MKRMNRISICFVSIVCLLLLAACGNRQIQDPTDTSEQSTGQKLENTTPQQSEKTDEPQPSTGTPEIAELNWKVRIVKGNILYKHDIATRFTDVITDYDNTQFLRIMRLNHETGTALFDYCQTQCGTKGFPCEFKGTSFSEKYPEAYFAENSLILINQTLGVTTPFAIKDVRYADGVLTCDWEKYEPPEEGGSQAGLSNYMVFIELDTVLPADTEIKVERQKVVLGTNAEYKEAQESLENKLEKL